MDGYGPGFQRPFTLAQLARRAGISESRARAMWASDRGRLPRPDERDADGRPLWRAATIDAWCARQGRSVSDDSLWFFRVPPAKTAAVELQRGMVSLGGRDRLKAYAIVWDTEHGHVIYLQQMDSEELTPGQFAEHAAELIEPRWWADALVIMPTGWTSLGGSDLADDDPELMVYRLRTADDGEPGRGGVVEGLRRWIAGPASEASNARPKADLGTPVEARVIAAAIGTPVPLWLSGTTLSEHGQQTLSYNQTFIVPDRATDWPAAQRRLERAIELGLLAEYPAAFALLCVDAAEGLATVHEAHEATPDRGAGWYLVCRPARPAPPIELEQLITSAEPVSDPVLVGNELVEMRTVEADLDVEDPRGEVFAAAIELMEAHLRVLAGAERRQYVAIADDKLVRYRARWAGQVVESWRRDLSPAVDVKAALRLRRVARLLDGYSESEVIEGFRDRDGRFVWIVQLPREEEKGVLAEWPVSLEVTEHWTDKTIIAGDNDAGAVTVLLALTPTEDGQMRVDPVPLPPGGVRDVFAYGYAGGTPAETYHALLRCALGDIPAVPAMWFWAPSGRIPSQLWDEVSTTSDRLRLEWPKLKLWARADRRRAIEKASTSSDQT